MGGGRFLGVGRVVAVVCLMVVRVATTTNEEYVETTGSMYNNDDSLFTTRAEARPTLALVVSLFPTFCSLLVILRVLTGPLLARSVLIPAFLTHEIIEWGWSINNKQGGIFSPSKVDTMI